MTPAIDRRELAKLLGASAAALFVPLETNAAAVVRMWAGHRAPFVREIHIDQDVANIDLRQLHDAIFPSPVGGEIIRLTVPSHVTVGPSPDGSPAIVTGSWPTGVAIELELHGRLALATV